MAEENTFMHIVRPNVSAPVASLTGPCTVKIHMPASFKILEIVSKQVITPNNRIIGSLLGTRSDDGLEYEIKDAFVVPSTETGETIAIDDHAHKILYQLYKKAHPKEHVLGWFDCANSIDTNTGLIHDFYSKGTDRAYPFPAIYLNVKFLSENKEIHAPEISTYIGAAIGITNNASTKATWGPVSSNSYVFSPIPNTTVNSSSSEKLLISLLTEKQQIAEPVSISSTAEDLSNLSSQLKALMHTIDNLLRFTENPPNSDEYLDLLRLLSNNILSKCKYFSDLNELALNFHVHNQDVIMIEYLTKAVKEQIELSARLTASSESEK